MTQNNNYSSLPVYTSLDQQFHRLNPESVPFHLPADAARILPISIVRPENTAEELTQIRAYRKDDTTYIDLTAIAANFTIIETTTYDVLLYPAISAFSPVLAPGFWYLRLTDGTYTWYTEVFTIALDLTPFVKLEFSHSAPIRYTGGQMDYSGNYKQRIYLSTNISRPRYPLEIQAKVRAGYTFDEIVVSKKVYAMEFPAPEYLCDLLRTIRLHDTVTATCRGITYNIQKATPVIDWPEGEDLAQVEIEMECDTIVRVFGDGAEYTGKDFNNDFNPDFNAEV